MTGTTGSSRIPTGSVVRSTLSTSSRGTEDFSLAHILPGLPGCHGNLAAVGTVATPVPASAATTSPPERALSGKTLTVDELSVVQESRRLPVLRAVVSSTSAPRGGDSGRAFRFVIAARACLRAAFLACCTALHQTSATLHQPHTATATASIPPHLRAHPHILLAAHCMPLSAETHR